MLRKIKPNKETATIVFKLLHDSLLMLLIFFVLALIAEGLLPGIISLHIGPYKIALLILGNILAIAGIKKIYDINDRSILNKKTTHGLFVIILLLIFNSLFKLNIFLNLFVLILIVFSAYFIAKILQEE